MTPQEFAAAEASWHDFFLAVAGASAALLGLLFVGVSINLTAITGTERVDLRARAGQAFANLNIVLVIALLMLVPDPNPGSIALAFAFVAALGLLRVGQNVYAVARGQLPRSGRWSTIRRIGWTAVANGILLFTAARIWSTGDAAVIENLVTIVFVLMVGAADVAWSMLVEVSRETSG
jgi:modulator of FtsH protease